MRSLLFSLIFLARVSVGISAAPPNESSSAGARGAAVIREINFARQHPEAYAQYLSTLRDRFRGNVFVLPNGSLMRTREGVSAIDDAIRYFHRAPPIGPLAISTGMSLAAADHVADQAGGNFGHGGSDRSDPAARLDRYGTWGIHWGENISYGKATAREIVAALIIDDGLPERKHRQNIFNAVFNFAGAAIGPHARYRTVCSIEFAGTYAERERASTLSLLARN